MRALLIILLLLFAAAPAGAVQPDEVLPDPAMEHRAREISKDLRCLVCQNQSIDDSNAPLARDLRVLVRDRLKAGDSDTQVMEYVTDRYGDYVLLRPPFKATTLVLWIGPFVILGLGALATLIFLRGRRQETTVADTPALSEDEQRRIEALLRKDQS